MSIDTVPPHKRPIQRLNTLTDKSKDKSRDSVPDKFRSTKYTFVKSSSKGKLPYAKPTFVQRGHNITVSRKSVLSFHPQSEATAMHGSILHFSSH